MVCAFFVGRNSSKVNPAVITIPRHVVYDVPAAEAGKP